LEVFFFSLLGVAFLGLIVWLRDLIRSDRNLCEYNKLPQRKTRLKNLNRRPKKSKNPWKSK